MRKSGGIVALIAGLLGFIAAVITLLVGGIGSNFNADAGDTIIGLGWGGILICFLIIVLGAVAMNAKTFIPGILIIIASIFGAVYGGTLVAVLMILALVGGVLACMSDGSATIEMQSQDAKSNASNLIKIVVIAIVILIAILFLSKQNQPTSESPIGITIPDDTKLTAESSVLADAAPPTKTPIVDAPEVPVAAEQTDSLDEPPASDSTITTETALPSAAENQVIDMAFNDLYLDYNNLVGKTVKVSGHLMVFGDICSLTESQNLTAVLYTDTSKLSRESRKLILDQCSSGCSVELEGIVGSVQFLKGISATRLYKVETKTKIYTIETK